MKHQASPRFWRCYNALPKAVKEQAAGDLIREQRGAKKMFKNRIARAYQRNSLIDRCWQVPSSNESLSRNFVFWNANGSLKVDAAT